MALNSINTNIAAYYAQGNIGKASNMASTSIARLSSGNRIVRAADDVAAMSSGTSLRTNVTTLRMALINTSQGSSLLQVADGALSQITDILQRQKAIAIQAGSGSLTNAERSFLNQEFQNLTQEIDRLATQTNFNGVTLLDGSLFDVNKVNTADAAATSGSATISFTDNTANVTAASLYINEVRIDIGTNATGGTVNVARGNTLSDTLNNLVDALNATSNASLSGNTYSTDGSRLIITALAGGAGSNNVNVENSVQRSTALSADGVGTGGRIGTANGSVTTTSILQVGGFTVANLDADAVGATMLIATTDFEVTVDGTTTTIVENITAGLSLNELADAINENTSTTGVKATIAGSTTGYILNLEQVEGKDFTINNAAVAGTALYNTDNVRGSMTFDVRFVHANANAVNTDLNGVGLTANTVTINGIATGALDGTATLAELVTAVNTIAGATGVRAYVIDENDNATTDGMRVRFISATAPSIVVAGNGISNNANNTNITAATTAGSSQMVGLTGGADDGIGRGSTIATGVVGDSILQALNQTAASATFQFSDIASSGLSAALLNNYIRFDSGSQSDESAPTTNADLPTGFIEFEFVDASYENAAGELGLTQVRIGATLEETLDNLVSKINTYAGPGDYVFDQFTAKRDGRSVAITANAVGDVLERDGSAVRVTTNLSNTTTQISGSTLSSLPSGTYGAQFDNSSVEGVDVRGVTSSDFIGTIEGFSATFGGSSNQVDLAITIGGNSYAASGVTTNSASDQTVRFVSTDGGGYFDIVLAGGQGSSVTNQTAANNFATRLDAAFKGLTFFQNRVVDSYTAAGDIITNGTPTGSLTGTSLKIQRTDFAEVDVSDVKISAPLSGAGDAIIEFTVNGETYRNAAGIGDGIAANATVRFVSLTNANNFVEFKNGNTAIDFSTSEKAASFQSALKTALGIGSGGQSLRFQVGVTTTDTLSVRLNSISTTRIFSEESLDVLTQETAAFASDVIDEALDYVTSVRAEVGALQSRFDFAAANIQSSIQNQDAARGVLLDTDVASEATAYATAQVQLQAGIAVLAQANLLPQNLLKLIG